MTIRVGLEFGAPGGEYGCGAWVLDLTGCFTAAADEQGALGGVPGAIAKYAALLTRHDIPAPRLPTGAARVVQRFRSRWTEPDYEDNAIFADDLRPVTDREVAFVRALLAASRAELIEAAELAVRPTGRTVDEVLHHVADAELFYGTRLEDDPARLRGKLSRDQRDVRARLAEVRRWSEDRIASLPALRSLERTHRGERWTPRKVLRRYVYHEIEHLAELRERCSVPAKTP